MPSSIGRVSIVLPLNQFVHADEFDLLAIAAVGAADYSLATKSTIFCFVASVFCSSILAET